MPATSIDKPHAGRIAVVTGAARGIGQAIAVGLAEQGATVVGVIGFTRALSATLGDDGITVNVVLPSLTRTPMSEGLPEAIVNNSLGRQVIHSHGRARRHRRGSVLILAANQEQTTLSDTDRQKIAHGNAERILRL